MSKINIGYVTFFKLNDRVKFINEQELDVTIKAIRLDPSENDNNPAVLYMCGWFVGGIEYSSWFPKSHLLAQ